MAQRRLAGPGDARRHLAIVTVAVTMILRPLMGQSVGDGFTGLLSFVGVALAFLLLFLLGWRIIVAFIARSSPR